MKSIRRRPRSRALALALSATVLAETVKVDAAIPAYKRASGVSGNLNSIGSDTLNNLMTYWAEGFKKAYPNVNIQIEGKGSSTAPPALIGRHRAARADVPRDDGRREGQVRGEVRLQADRRSASPSTASRST